MVAAGCLTSEPLRLPLVVMHAWWAGLCGATLAAHASLPPEVVRDFSERVRSWEKNSKAEWHAEIKANFERSSDDTLVAGVKELPARLGGWRASGASIAIFNGGHDSAIAVGIDSRIQCVLELERWFNVRYFESWHPESFDDTWLSALEVVRDRCVCEDGPCPKEFDQGVLMTFPPFEGREEQWDNIVPIVEKVFTVKAWHHAAHHLSHALLAYHSSPFHSAVIVSYDGGGDDGLFNISTRWRIRRYWERGPPCRETGLQPGRHLRLPRGPAARGDWRARGDGGLLLPEVPPPARKRRESARRMEPVPVSYRLKARLSFSGKLMGYAATGSMNSTLAGALMEFFQYHAPHDPKGEVFPEQLYDAVPNVVLQAACGPVQAQRDLAASIQHVFDVFTMGIVQPAVALVTEAVHVEGIVMTGGCALNVITNQLIQDRLTAAGGQLSPSEAQRAPLEVFSPPAANDGGLAVGALWTLAPPLTRQPLQYPGVGGKVAEAAARLLQRREARACPAGRHPAFWPAPTPCTGTVAALGFPLWDEASLEGAAEARGARSLAALGGVGYLAELLAGGPAWQGHPGRSRADRPIVAVVRGRQEFGPRALGHRSLVAVPDSVEMRDRMNVLKDREWYRPVAPMVADEAMGQFLNRTVKSPYMTMAPRVADGIKERFPAVVHLDGTARHQSVGPNDEPFICGFMRYC
ncbi:unnamed protein product [Prorocentrum cordatum]|uniref:N6-L-threonylcarbamoyladenine synthase n=1 Tax=Prorocentrum cordatum TaxID=2364126 RepID=A0ABN9TNY0_9DINO|nr:unnamed protein product [Polarella glacialis]